MNDILTNFFLMLFCLCIKELIHSEKLLNFLNSSKSLQILLDLFYEDKYNSMKIRTLFKNFCIFLSGKLGSTSIQF